VPRTDRRAGDSRWATVFPMGMTDAASLAVARSGSLPPPAVRGHVLLTPGLTAWELTLLGATRRELRCTRADR